MSFYNVMQKIQEKNLFEKELSYLNKYDFDVIQLSDLEDYKIDDNFDCYTVIDAIKKVEAAKGIYYIKVYAKINSNDNFSVCWQVLINFINTTSLPISKKQLIELKSKSFFELTNQINNYIMKGK